MLDPVRDLFRGVVPEKRDCAEMCRFIYHVDNWAIFVEHCINLGSIVELTFTARAVNLNLRDAFNVFLVTVQSFFIISTESTIFLSVFDPVSLSNKICSVPTGGHPNVRCNVRSSCSVYNAQGRSSECHLWVRKSSLSSSNDVFNRESHTGLECMCSNRFPAYVLSIKVSVNIS